MPSIDFNSFDYLSDSVVITDGRLDPPGPRILHVNRAFTRMTGYDAEEVIGKTPRVLQGPKTHSGMLERWHNHLSRGEDVVLETVNYRKDGGELGLEWSVKPVRDKTGRITNFLTIQRDVTERMLVQSTLFERKDRLEAALDAIGQGILLTDRQGKVTHLNPTAASLTGWTPEQATGRPLAEVLPLARCVDEQPLPDLAQESLEQRRTVEPRDPCIVVPRRGAPILVKAGASPIRSQPGRLDGVAVWLRRLETAEGWTQPHDGEISHQELIDANEFLRRLQRIVESARDLGSVHAIALIELDPVAERVTTDRVATDPAMPAPDRAFRRIAREICQRIRQSDTLAELDTMSATRPDRATRYGLILHHCPLHKAIGVARALLVAIREVAGDNGKPIYRAAIGLVPFSAEARDADQLLDRGRHACAEARTLGGDRVQVFRSEASDRARKEHEILRAVELLQAIEQNQLQLHGQEIVPLKLGLPRHVEVLVRMPDSGGGHVSPAAFVRAAERYDLAARLDRWVVTTVLASYRRLFGDSGVGVTINLSAKSVGDEGLLDLVRRRLPEYDVPAQRVCFEITETAAVSDIERARAFVDALRQLGCRFALDDFGSGHASFRYLKALRVDYLKIDRGFVRDLLDSEFDLAMVEAFHKIGGVLGIRVIAEGVESREVLERLRDVGLDYAQGYVHGRPSPLEELAKANAR